MPDIIRYYLGEEPILPNVPTYLLWDADQRAEVLARLDELVVKPVAEAGGYGTDHRPAGRPSRRSRRHAPAIVADPRGYIAQEVVQLSRHPTLVDDHFEGRHVDLRPFVLSGEKVEVIPGGLTRVALRKGSLIVNSSQGGGSKDTWVLAPAPTTSDDDADGRGVDDADGSAEDEVSDIEPATGTVDVSALQSSLASLRTTHEEDA